MKQEYKQYLISAIIAFVVAVVMITITKTDYQEPTVVVHDQNGQEQVLTVSQVIQAAIDSHEAQYERP